MENLDDNFINKEFPQRCGDILFVLEKTNKQTANKTYLYRGEFQKYKQEVLFVKQAALRGIVPNPKIEQVEFIEKIHPQFCGDSLKVLEKIVKENKTSWKCTFIENPYIVILPKSDILRGKVGNPMIEKNFMSKIYKQNCGDSLKIISKTCEKDNWGKCYYKCQFLTYPSEILCLKQHILRGVVENPNLPWKNKTSLEYFINENFDNSKKITLTELAKALKVTNTTIGRAINKFNLQEYIDYTSSKSQKDIENYIKTLNINCYSKTFNKYSGYKEIDIFVPDKNIGFEYNGNYWHSELYKDKNYHQNKTLEFYNKENIKLFHIFEYEWLENEEKVKSLIKTKLGLFDKKIGARKCIIKELENKEYQDFCKKNHLQNEAGAKVKLGLFCKDELVQTMSFSMPRFTDKYDWEIIRECSKLGYLIIGGKEKLWKYFVEHYNPNNCISYCDFSKFRGESYLKLGFKKEKLNAPGFVWWDKDTNQIFWRNPFKHQEMKEKYIKIWDCGQLVFTWNKF